MIDKLVGWYDVVMLRGDLISALMEIWGGRLGGERIQSQVIQFFGVDSD